MASENPYVADPGELMDVAEEMGPIITGLKEGNIMTRYYSKRTRPPDQRIFMVKIEEFQLVWCRTGREGGREEGRVNIREIKEVRRGFGSKDFERNLELSKRLDPNCCLVIFYGNEFRLKTLSCVARSNNEREYWVKGLVFLMYESLIGSQPVLIYRWLLKEWNALTQTGTTTRRRVGMREIKTFFQRGNIKVSNNKLKEIIQSADRQGDGQIDFEGLRQIYNDIMNVKEVSNGFSECIENGTYVPIKKFQKFMLDMQHEQGAKDFELVKRYMHDYLQDKSRNYAEPYFTVSEFMDYLFSRGNSVFNSAHCEVYQDMTRPLNHYWVASSHNTYLTADQFQGEASVEAYIRCLRMGCRCLELDCWDGPEDFPIITHGHTLVSKIKFVDVLRAIKENAFVASDFPLVLSLENHCSIPQQKNMSQAFKEIFGSYLLTQPVDFNEKEMPSPMELKHKIILKHKKLPKDPSQQQELQQQQLLQQQQQQQQQANDGEAKTEDDLSQSAKNGYLLLEDEIDHGWKRHFFCLTMNTLSWTEEQTRPEDEDEDDSMLDGLGIGESAKDELHFGEKWFHGKLPDGRRAAEQLLNQYNRGDGSFLVRESDTFVGDFSLSFWRKAKVQHCRIKSKQENGQTKYYLVDQVTFDSLYSLINHYQAHPLKSMNFELTLSEAIPQPNAHLDKDWYHDNLTRDKAEDMLKRVRKDGAFLVRRKDTDEKTGEDSCAISFRADGKIKHCRIKRDGRLYTIGTAQFESLVELVEFYMKHSLYKGMRLKYPINEVVLSKVGQSPDEEAIYGTGTVYHEPNAFVTKPACRALWDYEAQNPDEMSFCRGAFITNVIKEDGGWWIGDYGGQVQKFFPANYCEEINYVTEESVVEEEDENEDKDLRPLGDLQKGCIDIDGCTIEMPASRGAQKHLLRILKHGKSLLEACAESQEDLNDWLQVLQEVASRAEEREARIRQMVRQTNLSQELSDLVVYFQPVPFNLCYITGRHCEMSSFPETKVENFIKRRSNRQFIKYHQKQISRVYPKGSRIDSSNYDPALMWNCGVQLCALNYQTPDRAMQLNHGKFLDNGRCGYVLQPECLRQDGFDVHDRDKAGVEPWTLTLMVLAARHLVKSGRGIASPFVEVEIVGAPYDNNKFKTETKVDNGLNPVWGVPFEVDIINPTLAYLRFVVYDEDMFGEPNFIAHAIFPVCSLKEGYRSVPLKNAHSEEFELSSLLVKVELCSAKGGDESLYASIQGLRDRVQEISCQMQTEEIKAREAMSQMNYSTEVERYRDDHQHNMESLGRQLRQQQDELRKRQQERAAKSQPVSDVRESQTSFA